MGVLAVGSGASFTSATLTDQTTAGAEMDIVAARALNVQVGNAQHGGTDTNVNDLPDAAVDGETQNEDLTVRTAILNNAGEDPPEFDHLLTVENNGDDEVSVGFGYNSNSFDTDFLTNAEYDTDEDDVKDVYEFKVNEDQSTGDAGSDEGGDRISPGRGDLDDDPPNYGTIPSGEELAVDLEIDLGSASSDIVSEIAQEASLSGGDPFEDETRDPVRLIDQLVVGTEE